MITQENLLLTRAEPNGLGGVQFLYKVNSYGLTAISKPQENISNIHWEVDVIRYKNEKPLEYEICHATELTDKTLKFYNDKALNEFLQKAFGYFNELSLLDDMLPNNKVS
jgi:hypothetical protein